MDKIDKLREQVRQQHERICFLEHYILTSLPKPAKPFIHEKTSHSEELGLASRTIQKSSADGFRLCTTPENIKEGARHEEEVKRCFIADVVGRAEEEQRGKIERGEVKIRINPNKGRLPKGV